MNRFLVAGFVFILAPEVLMAGGPKYVAGTSFFNTSVVGQPVHWSGGVVKYYVDKGVLNSSINNQQAKAMVDAAAALWSAVPTAGMMLVDAGSLSEDVSGTNVVPGNAVFAKPVDVAPTATGKPLGIVFDADGSVINAIFGSGASDPSGCQNDGVWTWLDTINADATIGHAVIILNGLCATNSNLVQMMNFQLERASGECSGWIIRR